jgi:DNA-directed RNA polymerase beta subunit
LKSEGIFVFYKDKGICIETFEGMNARFITSLIVHAKVNTHGYLKTPFYKISELSREEGIIHLSVGEDEYHQIAT